MENKKNKFKEIISNFHEKNLDYIIDRQIEIPLNVPKVVSIIGPRRAGKTSLCLQTIRQLRLKTPSNLINYINFEDDRLYPLQLKDMDSLIQAYYELFPENRNSTVYFFLDEIQEVNNWEKFVRRLLDTENCRIYITGSSSTLLSREISTTLRGRTLTYEVFPLSFSEFLNFKHIRVNSNTSKGKAQIQNALDNYITQGGFPELIFLEKNYHRQIISEYINLLLYKDLVERFNVKSPSLLKYLLKYTLNNISTLLSVNKIYNDLKSQGFSIGKNTVYEYLTYLEETFALHRVQRSSKSERQKSINPDKIYTIDTAFKYNMTGNADQGRVLENIIYLELRRHGFNLCYWKGNQEVDFYVENKYLINVCLDMTNIDTKQREFNGINEAMSKTIFEKAFIITYDDQFSEQLPNGEVIIMRTRDFLLNIKEVLNPQNSL